MSITSEGVEPNVEYLMEAVKRRVRFQESNDLLSLRGKVRACHGLKLLAPPDLSLILRLITWCRSESETYNLPNARDIVEIENEAYRWFEAMELFWTLRGDKERVMPFTNKTFEKCAQNFRDYISDLEKYNYDRKRFVQQFYAEKKATLKKSSEVYSQLMKRKSTGNKLDSKANSKCRRGHIPIVACDEKAKKDHALRLRYGPIVELVKVNNKTRISSPTQHFNECNNTLQQDSNNTPLNMTDELLNEHLCSIKEKEERQFGKPQSFTSNGDPENSSQATEPSSIEKSEALNEQLRDAKEKEEINSSQSQSSTQYCQKLSSSKSSDYPSPENSSFEKSEIDSKYVDFSDAQPLELFFEGCD